MPSESNFKPIRKEEVIIKTASQVCHDKWRGVLAGRTIAGAVGNK